MIKHQSNAPVTGGTGLVAPSLTPGAVAAALVLALNLGQAVALEGSNLRFDSTRDLHAVCSVPASAAEHIVAHQACRAFIEGVAQYHDLISKPGKMQRLYCMPKGSTVEDGLAAFNAWASAESKDAKLMGEEPALGLVRALAAKYPCKG